MTCQSCETSEFTTQQLAQIDEILNAYKDKKEALILVLEKVQLISGYLPESIQRRVAKGLNVPLSKVYGVVTFYSFFTMKPRGKHEIRLCLGTACHVRGAERNFQQIKSTLGIGPGELTDDRMFSLEIVRCLGACGLAPVMTVGKDTHRQVKDIELKQIFNRYADQ
jgi:NADH:ubiquinone oxidoreductase subunit E